MRKKTLKTIFITGIITASISSILTFRLTLKLMEKTIEESERDNEIIFDSYEDAEHVLGELVNLLEKYRVIRVSDLYDICELTNNHINYQYGWTDLSEAKVIKDNLGYKIQLPIPKHL